MTFGEYVGLLQARALRGARAALPVRRVPRRPPDHPRRGEDRGAARPDRVARRARAAGRLEPARRVGGAGQPARRRRRRAGPVVPPAAAVACSRTRARSGCWCATSCSAACSSRRSTTGTRSASSTPRPASDADRWGDALDAVLRRARRDRHRRRRPRPVDAHDRPRAPTEWGVRQIFDDPAGDHDWGISAAVDLAASASRASRSCGSPTSGCCDVPSSVRRPVDVPMQGDGVPVAATRARSRRGVDASRRSDFRGAAFHTSRQRFGDLSIVVRRFPGARRWRSTFVLVHGLGGVVALLPAARRRTREDRHGVPRRTARLRRRRRTRGATSSIDDHAEVLASVPRPRQARNPVIVGHSMGAQVVARGSRSHHPGRCGASCSWRRPCRRMHAGFWRGARQAHARLAARAADRVLASRSPTTSCAAGPAVHGAPGAATCSTTTSRTYLAEGDG